MSETKSKPTFISTIAIRREHFLIQQSRARQLTIRDRLTDTMWQISYFIFRPIFRTLGVVKINYLDPDFSNVRHPIIIMSNHRGIFDPWIIFSSLPFSIFKKLLPIRPYATKRFALKKPILGTLNFLGLVNLVYYLYRVIVIPESDSFVEKLAPSIKSLSDNESLLFFPEGGLTTTDEIRPFRRGIVELHRQSEVPILPCTIKFQRGGLIGYRVVVTFGELKFIPKKILNAGTDEVIHRQGAEYLHEAMSKLYHDYN